VPVVTHTHTHASTRTHILYIFHMAKYTELSSESYWKRKKRKKKL